MSGVIILFLYIYIVMPMYELHQVGQTLVRNPCLEISSTRVSESAVALSK